MDGMTNRDGSDEAKAAPPGSTDEPALTQRNTATVGGEQELGRDADGDPAPGASTADAAPTYGPAGNTTDAEEEGAGDAGS